MEVEKIKAAIMSPKLLLSSEIPSDDVSKFYRISFLWCAFAIFNWRLGAAVAMNRNFRFFIFDFMLSMSVFLCFLIFYIPVVHLFSENHGYGSKRFISYLNFSTTLWITLLPLALISAALGRTASFLLFQILSLSSVFYIYFILISGMSAYYQKTKLKSFFILILPLILFSVFFLIVLILIAGMIFPT